MEYLVKKYGDHVTDTPQANLSVHFYQNKLAVSAGGTISNNTYKWFRAGQPEAITILGDSTFLPTRSGVYYAKITNSIVDGLTLKTDTIHYTMPLAKKELKISISPNPARDMISIHGLNENSGAKITIADMGGYVWVKAMSRQLSALRIDVSRLKAGNYLVNVSDGKEVKTVMFVKE